MPDLQRLFGKYTGWLRRLKAGYVINNVLQRKRLQHNKSLYEHYGLQRSIYAPVGYKNLRHIEGKQAWLDRPDAQQQLKAHPVYQAADAARQQALDRFVTDGYLLLPDLFSPERVAALNQDIDRLLREYALDFNYTGRKIMDAHSESAIANQFFRDESLLFWLEFLLGTQVIPFHTINFIRGSEQKAHSDSIHMSTQPQGYLVAAWIALEDIGPEQGPLTFYPGSHRLPYLSAEDFAAGNSRFLIGANPNRKYEDYVAKLIQEKGWKPTPFLAKAGDVFIWHANLLHGGSAITQEGATRRSMVAHYFGQGAICYHEISQRPALLPIA